MEIFLIVLAVLFTVSVIGNVFFFYMYRRLIGQLMIVDEALAHTIRISWFIGGYLKEFERVFPDIANGIEPKLEVFYMNLKAFNDRLTLTKIVLVNLLETTILKENYERIPQNSPPAMVNNPNGAEVK